MSDTNFLEETLDILKTFNKTPEEVRWVGDDENFISWNEFAELANFEYDDSWGSNEINMNLKVVGDNWWLDRHEYDGSEWWEFKTLPKPGANHKRPKISFHVDGE